MGSYNRYLQDGWVRVGIFDLVERRSMWVRYTTDIVEICAGREGDDAIVSIGRTNPAFDDLSNVIGTAVFARDQLIGSIATRMLTNASPTTVWLHEVSVLSADLQRAVATEVRCQCSSEHEHEHGAYLTSETCPFAIAGWSPDAWAGRLGSSLHLASMLQDHFNRLMPAERMG